jgi:hypothetical protein
MPGGRHRGLLSDDAERRRLEERALAAAAGTVLVGPDRRANRQSVRAGAHVRVVYMAKAKRSAARALEWLASRAWTSRRSWRASPTSSRATSSAWTWSPSGAACRSVSDEELYASPPEDVDLVVSFLFWKRIGSRSCRSGGRAA